MSILRTSSLLFCGLLGSSQLLAASETLNASTTDVMLVTAARSPLERVHVGNATTVITREQIERQQARYVTDLLRAVPGFAVSQSGARGSQTQVRVRGAEGNHVLVFIDGVRANDPANSDEFRWELLSAYNVARIEIIRGPQSALWGSDALAAVVYIDTQSGSGKTQFGGFAEGGSDDTTNAGFTGSTGGDDWSLNYGLSRLDTAGTNTSRTGTEDDGSDLTSASLSGSIQATEDLDLNIGLRLVDSNSEFDPIGLSGLPVDGDLDSDSQQAYLQAGGKLRTLGGRLTHHLNARYLDTSREDMASGVETSSSDSDRTTLTYQADRQLGDNLLSLAVEHERTTFEQRGAVIVIDPDNPALDLDPNQNQAMTVNSAVVDYQWQTSEKLTLLFSGRYDDYSDFDDAVTGRASISYRADNATKLRASIGTGQKVPTFTERFGFFPDQFIGNPNLKPEESTAFEFGIDRQLLNDALGVELTYFNQDLDNEINGFAFVPDLPLPTAVNIEGSSERKGVEMVASYNVTNDLELGANYTYTDSTSENTQGADIREVRRPRHAGSLYGNYRFADNRTNVYVEADYAGSQTDSVFLAPNFLPETVKLSSYWLVTLSAGYDLTSGVNVFARVTNLLDEDYEEIFGFQTPGRSAFAGIRVNFGE